MIDTIAITLSMFKEMLFFISILLGFFTGISIALIYDILLLNRRK